MRVKMYLEENIIVEANFGDICDTEEIAYLIKENEFIILTDGVIPTNRIIYTEKTEE